MADAAAGIARSLHRLDGQRGRRGLPAPQVLVRSPGLALEHGDLTRRFHCASVDKVLVAAAIGRLVDDGRARLGAPLGTVLPAADLELPAMPGVDPAAAITIEHLLEHTSGLPDFVEPPRGATSEASVDRVAESPDRRWTRGELFEQVRALPATGRPGERFGYSDTGYLLLHRVIEELTGLGYREALRALVLDPAGMDATAMPYDDAFDLDEITALDPAPIWLGRDEMSRRAGMTFGWGSILTTADDLVRFQEAIHGDALVSEATLGAMRAPRHRLRAGIRYGAGFVTLRFGELLPIILAGLPQPVGGLGLSAAHMFWYPRQRAHVILNFHGTREMNASFQTHIAIARTLARG